jgi:prefoldin subunit 5
MPFVLKHSKAIYERKINELESFKRRLDAHLEALEGYKGQIMQYWDDEHGQKYYNLLNEQIEAVTRANNRIERLRMIYEQATGDFEGAGSSVDEAIDEFESIIKTLG